MKTDARQQYDHCQSCGLPFYKDPKGGGSEADGKLSKLYCSHCYEDGKFLQPELTAQQMQEFAKSRLEAIGFPTFMAGMFTKGIIQLERWKGRKPSGI